MSADSSLSTVFARIVQIGNVAGKSGDPKRIWSELLPFNIVYGVPGQIVQFIAYCLIKWIHSQTAYTQVSMSVRAVSSWPTLFAMLKTNCEQCDCCRHVQIARMGRRGWVYTGKKYYTMHLRN